MNRNALREMTLFQFRSMLRNKISFFFNLVIPLIFLLVFGVAYKEPGSANFLMPGELTQMLLTGGIITVAIALAGQRQNGSMRHLFSTPLPIGIWLFTRILSSLMLTALQTAVLYVSAIGILKISPPSNVAATALVILVSSLCTLSFGMLIGVFTRSADAAMPVSMILYMALAFLGNAMMPIDNLPPAMLSISRLMPTRFITDALRETMMLGHGLGSVTQHLMILAGIAAVGLSISVWRLRRQFVTM